MHGLLTAFPENGLTLYNTLDYWRCKDLLDINSNGKIDPGTRIQEDKNAAFNEFLDANSFKKLEWSFIEGKFNLWQIKKKSEDLLNDRERS